LRGRLKEVHAHELDPSTPFVSRHDKRRTVADLLDALKVDYEIREKDSPQNLSGIKRARADFGSFRAGSLTKEQIDLYVVSQRKEGYADATINRITQLLKQAYQFAKLPAPEIRKLSEIGNVRSGFFSREEIRRVIANLPADLADSTSFAWCTGMRKSEIASLAWENVDGDVIRLRAEDAKSRKPRVIPLEGELAELIKRRRAARELEIDGVPMICALIFHRAGEPIREFRKAWATACKKAGIRRLFHDLRRSACRNMVNAGVPQSIAMKISGHRTDAMFKRYAIGDEADLRTALRRTQKYVKTVKETVVAMPAKRPPASEHGQFTDNGQEAVARRARK
jgi:integrase